MSQECRSWLLLRLNESKSIDATRTETGFFRDFKLEIVPLISQWIETSNGHREFDSFKGLFKRNGICTSFVLA